MYLQPIKNDDPRLDFFTMYKREAMEYDTDYIQKYNEDLNTTLIFVRFCVSASLLSVRSADHTLRPVCSPLSALRLSSMSSPNSSQIPANGPKPTSERSLSASTDPLFLTKTPLLPRCGRGPPQRSSQPRISCTQVC